MSNESNWSVDALAKISNDGFTAATFPEIRDAIARKMAEIYGYDIDLSSASADGQYINMEALVVNNIYRTLELLAKSLNPSSASGSYLDILASFSGALRRQATYSKAQLYIWNTENSSISPEQITVMDKNGQYWQWKNWKDLNNNWAVTIDPMGVDRVAAGPFEFTCIAAGPVEANTTVVLPVTTSDWQTLFDTPANTRGGDIYQTINVGGLQVVQTSNAVPGQWEETDQELRTRRLQTFGQAGSTVLNSLNAALLALDGVDDVFVYSNMTGDSDRESQTLDDGMNINGHNTYVCVWANPTLLKLDGGHYTVSDEMLFTIASIIFDQLTPGVVTQGTWYYDAGQSEYEEQAPNYGEIKDYYFPVEASGDPTRVSWKLCTPIADNTFTITMDLSVNNDNPLTTTQIDKIQDAIMNYLNNLSLTDPVNISAFQQAIYNADLRAYPYGTPTFTITNIAVSGASIVNGQIANRLSRYNILKNKITYNASTKIFTVSSAQS